MTIKHNIIHAHNIIIIVQCRQYEAMQVEVP